MNVIYSNGTITIQDNKIKKEFKDIYSVRQELLRLEWQRDHGSEADFSHYSGLIDLLKSALQQMIQAQERFFCSLHFTNGHFPSMIV